MSSSCFWDLFHLYVRVAESCSEFLTVGRVVANGSINTAGADSHPFPLPLYRYWAREIFTMFDDRENGSRRPMPPLLLLPRGGYGPSGKCARERTVWRTSVVTWGDHGKTYANRTPVVTARTRCVSIHQPLRLVSVSRLRHVFGIAIGETVEWHTVRRRDGKKIRTRATSPAAHSAAGRNPQKQGFF